MWQRKVINNNSPDNLSPDMVLGHFKRINPDKFTFLKSNQLVTSYLQKGNVKENSQTFPKAQTDAYEQAAINQQDHELFTQFENDKNQRVISLSKKNSNFFFSEGKKKQKHLQLEYQSINSMKEMMYTKASDIMNGLLTSSFTRNTTELFYSDLKKIKETTCQQRMIKLQHTKKLMKKSTQSLVKENKISPHKKDKLNESEISKTETSFCGPDSSLISAIDSNAFEKTDKKEEKYRILRSCHSYDNIFDAERRRATRDAFGMCWKQGATNKNMKKNSLWESRKAKSQIRSVKRIQNRDHVEQKSPYEQIENASKPRLANNHAYSTLFLDEVEGFRLSLK